MDMLDRNPSGGYLTNGRVSAGVMVSLVPGGRASRPSVVIHSRRFCRECGTLDEPSSPPPSLRCPSSVPVTLFSNHIDSNNTVHKYDLHEFFIPVNRRNRTLRLIIISRIFTNYNNKNIIKKYYTRGQKNLYAEERKLRHYALRIFYFF